MEDIIVVIFREYDLYVHSLPGTQGRQAEEQGSFMSVMLYQPHPGLLENRQRPGRYTENDCLN